MRSGRRASLALLGSVVLHLLVLAYLASRSLPAPPPAPPAEPHAFHIEIVELSPAPAPAPTPPPAPVKAAPKRPARPVRSEQPATATPPAGPAETPPAEVAAASDSPKAEPSERAAEEASSPAAQGGGAATSQNGLFPVLPGVAGGPGKGRTIREGDPELDPKLEAARTAARVKQRVQEFVASELAASRVQGGVVDTYFGDLRKSLQKRAENPPKYTAGSTFVHDLVSAWTPGAQKWAKTGNPYGEGQLPSGHAERETTDPLAIAARDRQGSFEAEMYAKQQAHDRFREFAEGRFGEAIVALVEIRQARDGGFLGAVLLQSSGNHLFDKHVLETAPTAIAEAPPPPARGAGLHEDGMRTEWAFEGRIVYTHKKKPNELTAKDALGMAAMGALSGLTGGWVPASSGSFDETTGEMEVVDLTQPRFTCKVKLLRVY